MTLWNLIRDFFVQNFFGGTLSNGEFIGHESIVGTVTDTDVLLYDTATTCDSFVNIGDLIVDNEGTAHAPFITFGDWFSTTFTIITLVLFIIFLYIFVKWIFKLFAGLLYR